MPLGIFWTEYIELLHLCVFEHCWNLHYEPLNKYYLSWGKRELVCETYPIFLKNMHPYLLLIFRAFNIYLGTIVAKRLSSLLSKKSKYAISTILSLISSLLLLTVWLRYLTQRCSKTNIALGHIGLIWRYVFRHQRKGAIYDYFTA